MYLYIQPNICSMEYITWSH